MQRRSAPPIAATSSAPEIIQQIKTHIYPDHPAWVEHQRKRWLRHDWQRWIRPDADRWVRPGWDSQLPPLANESKDNSADAALSAEIAAERELLARLRAELAAINAELEFRRAFRNIKYSPDQPRVPAGNPDGGEWTSGDEISTDISAARRRLPIDVPALPLPHLLPSNSPGGTEPQREPITINNNAQTGISTIDETTDKLGKVLENVVNALPQGSGAEYGTKIHTDFANSVRSENLRGIGQDGVERSFGPDVYGSKDSIRTDVVLRNDIGDPIAIYDVKTGNATLRPGRVQELLDKVNAGQKIPVIEMHVLRGLSLKGRTDQRRYFWIISIRLWNHAD